MTTEIEKPVEIRQVICGLCTEHHILNMKVQDEKIIGLASDKEAGVETTNASRVVAGCLRAHGATDFHNHKNRLNYPLKRAGERGENKWQRITWDQAMDEIAEKLTKIKDQYGPEGIAISTLGETCALEEYRARFMNLLGTPTFIHHGQVCTSSVSMLSYLLCGNMIYFGYINKDTRCIFMLGKNPEHSANGYWRKIEYFQKEKGVKLIVVDPRKTKMAEKADIWLQPRPGTDSALMLGMINVIISEGLYDKEFVEKWTHGFDRLAERAEEYPLEKVEEITRVPAEKIRAAARMYATNTPCVTDHGMGSEHTYRALQSYFGKCCLAAICGNVDTSGGDYLPGLNPYITPLTDVQLDDRLSDEQREKVIGSQFPLLGDNATWKEVCKNVARVRGRRPSSLWIHEGIAHPPSVFRAMMTGKPYPVRAMIEQAISPLLTFPNTKLMVEAVKTLDLYVVHDITMTPSCLLADYVLPSAAFMEKPYLRGGDYFEAFHGSARMIQPEYERKEEYYLWRELGRRMGQEEYWPWENLEEAFDERLTPLGITFKEFMDKGGHHSVPYQYKKYEQTGFGTSTGKFELCSTWLEKLGFDPMPSFKEREVPPEIHKEYPLYLLTGARNRQYYASQLRHVDYLRKRAPYPAVHVHPETAEKLGINVGDWVWIETPLGRCRQVCHYADGVHPDVIAADHGWWFPEEPAEWPSLHGLFKSNINVVVDDNPDDPNVCDPMSGAWMLKGMKCKIYKAEGFELAKK